MTAGEASSVQSAIAKPGTASLDARSGGRGRDIAISAGLLALALAAIAGLVAWSGLGLDAIASRLERTPVWLIASLATIVALQATLSGVKWRIVLGAAGTPPEEIPPLRFCIGVTALAILLSNVMTTFLSAIVTRGLVAKRVHGMPVTKGALTTTYEQVYDAALIVMFALVTALAWSFDLAFGAWLGLVALGVVGIGAAIALVGAMRARLMTLELTGRAEALRERVLGWAQVGLFRPGLIAKLLGLSLLRYALLAMRAVMIAAGLGYSLAGEKAFQAHTLVQSTQLAAITPGNLGIQEWGWAAALSIEGLGTGEATDFALALRILTFVTTIAVTITLAFLLIRQGRRA